MKLLIANYDLWSHVDLTPGNETQSVLLFEEGDIIAALPDSQELGTEEIVNSKFQEITGVTMKEETLSLHEEALYEDFKNKTPFIFHELFFKVKEAPVKFEKTKLRRYKYVGGQLIDKSNGGNF